MRGASNVKREESANRSAAAKPTVPARLIVCERTGRWAAALRHELVDSGVRVWETRALDDCWNELAESPASFVVLELGADVAGLVGRVMCQAGQFPAARLAVVADRSLVDHQWLMREAGAVDFLCSPREAGSLAQLACRHLAQAPPRQQGLAERIWASLPWAAGSGEPASKD